MCRHFEHTHPFGDTPSITLHSPLSSRSPKQKFAGYSAGRHTKKCKFQTVGGARQEGPTTTC